ncbi:4Fe-4S dicluster domain-containing protein [Metallosphaera tengchongensis]|uniref:4Fe-4S dicluster domain-containing protein n=1 Tax=Metallosphaera tengchongensis TaxID=1532350 RepID=A0A6N0NVT5_9CREN|nr:4Fe-4S dicluster domain-containing protein [Metallosphaera tengchongensis]QKR00337.1 4Fe-4S dicluster domain-containing protein [Metallosphaera tengchongensis]
MAGIIYSAISRTRRGETPKQVIRVFKTEDAMTDGKPRYEYFRGESGETVLDLTDLRGVEDLGDRIRVKAGTPWSDLVNFSLEVFGPLEASVGGSVYYEDGFFGFNEFGSLRRRVEVEAVAEGKVYVGQYRGGTITSVTIRKDLRPLVYKKLERSLSFLLNRVKYWYSTGLPAFRDVTIIKRGDSSALYVSYPQAREELLKDKLDDMVPDRPYFFETGNYRYKYFGYINTQELSDTLFSGADQVIIFLRKDVSKFIVSSNLPLNLPQQYLLPYSDDNSPDLFSGCILCGKCVYVCPHVDQRGDKDYSPLGFFIAKAQGMESQFATCNFCGKCEEVCPAKLEIVKDLKVSSRPKDKTSSVSVSLPSKKALVITPISDGLLEQALTAIRYFLSKDVRLGIITVDTTLEKLVKGEEIKVPEGVEEIYTLTPEERVYLLRAKPRNVVDVIFLFDALPKEVKERLNSLTVHKTCMYRGDVKGDESCSFAFMEMVNGEPSRDSKVTSSKVSLCPLASKKLKILSYLDLLEVEKGSDLTQIQSELVNLLSKNQDVIQDLSWYEGIDEGILDSFMNELIGSYLKGKNPADLVYIYVKMNELEPIKGSKVKEILEKKIREVWTT